MSEECLLLYVHSHFTLPSYILIDQGHAFLLVVHSHFTSFDTDSTMINASYTSVFEDCLVLYVHSHFTFPDNSPILGQTSARGSAGGRDHCLTHHRTTTCTPVTNETRDL